MTVHLEFRAAGELESAIGIITLDRPERRNAVNHESLAQLTEALDTVDESSARVLILCGAGGHFCAGADLTGVEDSTFASLL